MTKFLVLYLAPATAAEAMAGASPEDMQKGMEPWMAWATRCGDKLVDMGSPLGSGQRITSAGGAPSGTEVTGYSILEATDMTEANVLLDGHPHLSWADGCAIDVHEAMSMGM